MKLLFVTAATLLINFFNQSNHAYAMENSFPTSIATEVEIESACIYLHNCGHLYSRNAHLAKALIHAPSEYQKSIHDFFKNLNKFRTYFQHAMKLRAKVFDEYNIYVDENGKYTLSHEAEKALEKMNIKNEAIAKIVLFEETKVFSIFVENHPLRKFFLNQIQGVQKSMISFVSQDPSLYSNVKQRMNLQLPPYFSKLPYLDNTRFLYLSGQMIDDEFKAKPEVRAKNQAQLLNEAEEWKLKSGHHNKMKGAATLGAMGLTGGLAMIALPGIADSYQTNEIAENCQQQFNLSNQEVDYLKEHITVLETMGAKGCQLAFTPIDFYSKLEAENKLSPGLLKMMTAKLKDLKNRTNIDLKFESSKNNVCESADIYDGNKKLASVLGGANGPLKISIIENNIAYQVSLKKVPELTFATFSLECLKANGEKDGVCTANLQSYLGSFGRGGINATSNGPDYFVNHFKDPISFNELCSKNANRLTKDKKVVCDYLSRVERLQVALSGLDILCGNVPSKIGR